MYKNTSFLHFTMKLFLAGTSVSNPEEEKKMQLLFKNGSKLHSYYHCLEGFEQKWFQMNIRNKVDLFLDSGAFSAWTQNVHIDILEYINFIKEHSDVIKTYSNLDVIGDPDKTLENQRIMEDHGLTPIPTFHYGEDLGFLERYIDEYEYIALGGMVGIRASQLKVWLDRIFKNYICNANGTPVVKVHGFGMTSLKLLLRYPWYSVDSTSWVVTGRLGSIYVPIHKNGKYLYDENSLKISVSNKSPKLKEAGKHIKTLSPLETKNVMQYIDEKGYTLGHSKYRYVKQDYELNERQRWAEGKPQSKSVKRLLETIVEPGLSNTYQLRDELNIIYFQDLEKFFKPWPWNFETGSVLNSIF